MMRVVEGVFDGEHITLLERVVARPNTRVMVTFVEDITEPAATTIRLEDVAGCLPYLGEAKTVEQMEEAIALGVQREWS
jgi:hypothetical protein